MCVCWGGCVCVSVCVWSIHQIFLALCLLPLELGMTTWLALASDMWAEVTVSFSAGSFKSEYTIRLILFPCQAIAETLTGSLHQHRSLGKDNTGQKDIWCEQEINLCFFKPLRFEGYLLLQHNPANHNWFYIYMMSTSYIWCMYHIYLSHIYKYKYIHPLFF